MQTLSLASHAQEKKTARLGQINFINSLPVVIPLLARQDELKAKVVLATPSELNHQYAQGLLDLGAMSSHYFLGSGKMQLITGLSIASVGAVGSVLFFSKKELNKLNNCSVLVPMSSATSINLLSVLLQDQLGVKPVFINSAQPDIERDDVDAALVIGDQALLVDDDWSKKYLRVDMGQWWYSLFQLPMIFGVWAANKKWVELNDDIFKQLSQSLADSAQEGLTVAFDQVIEQSMQRLPLSHKRLEHYFRHELNFEFGVEHERGLSLYRELCLKYNLLDSHETLSV